MPSLMAAATNTRLRPAPETIDAPPAKRYRSSHDTHTNGLAKILLNGNEGSKLTAAYATFNKNQKIGRVDDSRAVISNGDIPMADASQPEIVEISSDSSSSEDDSDDEEEDDAEPIANGISHEEDAATEPEYLDEDDIEEEIVLNGYREPSIELGEPIPQEEPSFGEQLHAEVAEVIDVEASLANAAQESTALVSVPGTRTYPVPTAASLGTVLAQSLRTNDRQMLESCFDMHDLASVRSTIVRLPSNLVANLLSRLAERIHKRPGRAGNLMVWVQWAIVSHGGYLASQPQAVAQIRTLLKVIKERASGLPSLLQLKGKLDMLSAQQELRRSMQTVRNEDDDDTAVIYVEGEEEDSSEADSAAAADFELLASPTKSSRHALKARRKQEIAADVSDDEESLIQRVNGISKETDLNSNASDAEEDLFDKNDDSEEEEDEETSESDLDDDLDIESEMEEIPESDEEAEKPLQPSTMATLLHAW